MMWKALVFLGVAGVAKAFLYVPPASSSPTFGRSKSALSSSETPQGGFKLRYPDQPSRKPELLGEYHNCNC